MLKHTSQGRAYDRKLHAQLTGVALSAERRGLIQRVGDCFHHLVAGWMFFVQMEKPSAEFLDQRLRAFFAQHTIPLRELTSLMDG
jgi:hypothetical protein